MAYVCDWTCKVCRKDFHTAVPDDYTCCDCDKKVADRKRREYFGKLDALTIEERIREIEEWIYEHSHDGLASREIRF